MWSQFFLMVVGRGGQRRKRVVVANASGDRGRRKRDDDVGAGPCDSKFISRSFVLSVFSGLQDGSNLK